MNERVYDIALEVLRDYPVIDSWTFSRLELEKFAELLIRECVSQIAMIGVSNCENDDVVWAVDKSIENIRKHFGVEE